MLGSDLRELATRLNPSSEQTKQPDAEATVEATVEATPVISPRWVEKGPHHENPHWTHH